MYFATLFWASTPARREKRAEGEGTQNSACLQLHVWFPRGTASSSSGFSPASYWSADPHGVSALREGSVGLRGLTVGEKAWVVHVLVGVAMFCEAHVLRRAGFRRAGKLESWDTYFERFEGCRPQPVKSILLTTAGGKGWV